MSERAFRDKSVPVEKVESTGRKWGILRKDRIWCIYSQSVLQAANTHNSFEKFYLRNPRCRLHTKHCKFAGKKGRNVRGWLEIYKMRSIDLIMGQSGVKAN